MAKWCPAPLLCKLMNVANPYPDGPPDDMPPKAAPVSEMLNQNAIDAILRDKTMPSMASEQSIIATSLLSRNLVPPEETTRRMQLTIDARARDPIPPRPPLSVFRDIFNPPSTATVNVQKEPTMPPPPAAVVPKPPLPRQRQSEDDVIVLPPPPSGELEEALWVEKDIHKHRRHRSRERSRSRERRKKHKKNKDRKSKHKKEKDQSKKRRRDASDSSSSSESSDDGRSKRNRKDKSSGKSTPSQPSDQRARASAADFF
jgi:hypothetical protein